MSLERLNGLVMCTIEKDILDDINVDTIVEDFASRSAHRKFFGFWAYAKSTNSHT